jgi:hypothetical protein
MTSLSHIGAADGNLDPASHGIVPRIVLPRHFAMSPPLLAAVWRSDPGTCPHLLQSLRDRRRG